MRSYDVTVTALAIGATRKWTDNLISQHPVPGILARQRGVSRLVAHSALVRLAIIRCLNVEIGVGVGDAVRFAADLMRAPVEQGAAERRSVTIGHVSLSVDVIAIEHEVDARLREALESAPTLRRGRPALRSS